MAGHGNGAEQSYNRACATIISPGAQHGQAARGKSWPIPLASGWLLPYTYGFP